MRFTFLGTSSGTPTRQRNVAGAALRLDDGAVWILDCGEATQHRLLATDLRPGRIECILVTHLHGDHCFGLPGLLAAITVHGRRDEAVVVVGPAGLGAWIQHTRRVSRMGLGYPVVVHELPDDGPELVHRGIRIRALPMRHRIPCWGYLLEEPARRGRFDADRAAALGVGGADRGVLARGGSITLADGRRVGPEELLGPERPGRRLALLGDTAGATEHAGLCEEVDFALHECTYEAARAVQAAEWGHSTTEDVAAFARAARPRRLALTHFSSRYTADDEGPGVDDLLEEVATRAPGVPLVAGRDLEHVEIPYHDADAG